MNKKTVEIDSKAHRELKYMPVGVQTKFQKSFKLLEKYGKLETPYAKRINKINHEKNIFQKFHLLG